MAVIEYNKLIDLFDSKQVDGNTLEGDYYLLISFDYELVTLRFTFKPEIIKWLRTKGSWRLERNPSYFHFTLSENTLNPVNIIFENPQDEFLFKMTWL